jgi:hypothetical protein
MTIGIETSNKQVTKKQEKKNTVIQGTISTVSQPPAAAQMGLGAALTAVTVPVAATPAKAAAPIMVASGTTNSVAAGAPATQPQIAVSSTSSAVKKTHATAASVIVKYQGAMVPIGNKGGAPTYASIVSNNKKWVGKH